jgi:hypothetical protein
VPDLKDKFFDRIATATSLYDQQKVAYHGRSQYGIFSMITFLEQLPFVVEGQIYENLSEKEFEHHDKQVQFTKLDQKEQIF